ncbi:MAG: PAS domain S-box protein [Desulfobulbus sp.]|jgi:PAS domain S-box-containing protein|uniref:PAS domain S-box protein n=1 Tax=Desulfobulbus sp. TaxID=895 RepID=UPI00284AB909|nr:PAS domain S-box protein [Desulfobulbus sp.]MDR2550438.1 PAS domain S-box protein [Desulfobulbus sp.]
MKSITRNRFIAQATLWYFLLAISWIFLSDRLLMAFIDVPSLVWLSTAKGIFFVLVSSACFTLALRIVPADDHRAPARTREEAIIDVLISHPWPRLLSYAFAVVLTLVMLFVRMRMPVDFDERPLLLLFVLPISLAALLGGLGPGLIATAITSLLCLYFIIPPVHGFVGKASHDLFQWSMLVLDGLIISLASETIHRLRYREQTRRQQLEETNQALRASEERFRRLFENAPVAMSLADSHSTILAQNNRMSQLFGYALDELPTIADWQQRTYPDPAVRAQAQSQWQQALARMPHPDHAIDAGEYRVSCKDGSEKITQLFTCKLSDGSYLTTFIDITERVRDRTTILDRERKLGAIIDNTLALLSLKTADGRYNLANPNLQRLLGMDEKTIVGKTDTDLFPAESAEVLRANDRKVLATQRPCTTEEILVVKGRSLTFASNIFPIFDRHGAIAYLCRIAHDISERKQAEAELKSLLEQQQEARLAALNQMQDANIAWARAKATLKILQESEERLSLFIEHAPVALAMFDRQMCYLAASRRWRDDYTLGGQTVVGRSYYEVFPEIGATWQAVHRRVLAGEVVRADEDRFVRDNGRVQWLRWEIRPWCDADGEVGGIVIFAEDITRFKEAEEEVHRLNADLERRVVERTAELTAANRELDSFAYAVSHDLRAPLRAMNGFSRALIEDHGGQLQGEARMFLEQIIAGSRKMGELIDGLLTLSRSIRGPMRRQRIDLVEMSVRLLSEMAGNEPERKVRWEVDPELVVQGDASMIEAALRNLLANAWKYTSRREEALIRVHVAHDSEATWICVSDNGAGFDPSHAGKLFQPFQRLHRQEEFPGIGIGLATVQRIIHRHGGTITASGRVDAGAIFCFSLP